MIPKDLSDRFSAWRWEVAWDFNPGSPTYRLHRDDEQLFLKLQPTGTSIADEAQRLRWAAEYLPVPRIVEYGSDGDYDWLLTVGLPGQDATKLLDDPKALVIALAEGMRAFHDAAPVDQCPFDFTAAHAVEHVKARFDAGLIDPKRDFHRQHAGMSAEAAVDLFVATAPTDERPVVCHGDFSLPNIMIHDHKVTGYVDLGSLGISDPWLDLAACGWSLEHNLGPGYDMLLFTAYGAHIDAARLSWYRLLYDLR